MPGLCPRLEVLKGELPGRGKLCRLRRVLPGEGQGAPVTSGSPEQALKVHWWAVDLQEQVGDEHRRRGWPWS